MSDRPYTAAFRTAGVADAGLETYDHTKLSAINVCPTWGVLRYQMHKRMPSEGRAIALEAGSAMHEVFSFIRLASLMKQKQDEGQSQNFLGLMWNHHGRRLFGAERLDHIYTSIQDADDTLDVCKRGAIAVLD